MRKKELPNILKNFDFDILDDPEFKEDSVREEIIVPIIKGLGYTATRPNQIIRSRSLVHPYVSIGSIQKKINIVPDYLFEVNETPTWILDAKAPTEQITKSKHVEQAYSYAIHSEVRVKYFALCNGKEFVLYHISDIKPIVHFELKGLALYWENLKKILSPENVLSENNLKLKKDLGLHLKRLGFYDFKSLVFPDVLITFIAQLDPDMFTFSVGGAKINDDTYVASFDFDANVLNQMKGKIPEEAIEKLLIKDDNGRKVMKFPDAAYIVNVDCRIGEKLEENDNEIFQPLIINQILD
jgi:hypothetical protein